ncbi:hypothetical protein OsJ_05879 [Oryza sativa Japonica Group]|uniref:Pectate lyase n=1 Tax=Oryza sativa subsp. japonica TaxID=39947 RepID=B9F496_ORYSJ|nr:hypothetical protein OsJ_05879 [Oryza sativa Japonica Group]
MDDQRLQWRKPGSFLLVAGVFLAAAAAVSNAGIGEFDEHWEKRRAAAEAAAEEVYKPDPFNVTNESTERGVLRRELSGKNSKYKGPCLATNPIDRCWRCRKDWATDRKRLARCAMGFGRGATGGVRGKIYVVTDPGDGDAANPRYGTLRDKTIDGRGAQVHIARGGAGITVQFARNVIITSLHVHDVKHSDGGAVRDSPTHIGPRTRADGDGISLFAATDVWVDHVSMSMCEDGLIDVVQGSTGVTISNSHFTNHNDVMLFGASDSYPQDKVMQITVAFNHFGRGLVQRMPRCRWGFFHVVNNDYTHWLMYAIGGGMSPTILSQGNRYIAPPNIAAKLITRHYAPEWEWKNWAWRSDGDLFMNGAYFQASNGAINRKVKGSDMVKPKPGSYVRRLTRFAGALSCRPGEPC